MSDKLVITGLVEELASRAVPCSSIAELLGVSERYVRMILKGTHRPQVSETLPEDLLARCTAFRKRKVSK